MSGVIDKQVSNQQEFHKEMLTLYSAGVGVIVVRAKETYRAIEALRQSALAKNLTFKYWELVNGWRSFSPSATDIVDEMCFTSRPDAAIELVGEMKKIENGANDDKFPDQSVYAIIYFNGMLDKIPPVAQLLKEYSRRLPTTQKRLVIVAPDSVVIPQEMGGDVAVVDFRPPSYAELAAIYEDIIQHSFPTATPLQKAIHNRVLSFSYEEKDMIIASAAGMTHSEFETALSCAVVKKLPSSKVTELQESDYLSADDFLASVLKTKTDVVKRSEILELLPADNMSSVGGLENLKEWIAKRKHCFTEEARKYGVDTPKGIALIGIPGAGKSLAAKAIASELNNIPLIKFDVSKVFKSLVGQSENTVRQALKDIEAMAPCVALIDEVDKAFQTGGGNDSGVGTRVLGAILTWMQETTAPVFVVVTANRTDNLPSEFLRKGRLDEVFSVTLPTAKEREDIIRIHLKKRGKEYDRITDIEEAVAKSEGYVPAEIEAAVKESVLESFINKVDITGHLIAQQLEHIRPLSVAFAEQFNHMRQWAENNARPANKPEEATNIAKQARVRTKPNSSRRSIDSTAMDG